MIRLLVDQNKIMSLIILEQLGSTLFLQLLQYAPTVLLVKVDLSLVLFSALQSLLHLLGHLLAGVGPVQEAAAAVLLHHLSSCKARQFAEAI